MPATINNLTIANSAGVSLSGNDQTVSGTLALTSGMLTTSANSLIIGAAGSVTRTSGWILGNEQKVFGSTGAGKSFTFDIGDSSDYEPLAVSSLTVNTTGNLKASTTHDRHPQLGTAGLNSSGCVAQYWTLSVVSGSYGTYQAQFTYPVEETSGTPSTYFGKLWNGSAWSTAGSVSGMPENTTTTLAGLSSFGDFALGSSGPIAIADSFTRAPNLTLKILKSALIANDTGSSVAFLSVSSSSTQGGTVVAGSGLYVFYTPANNNSDTFTYTITDIGGATAVGTVTINVVAPGGIAQSITATSGTVEITFFGIPDFQYDLQRATAVEGTYTTITGPQTSSASDGKFTFTDTPGSGSFFYRSIQH